MATPATKNKFHDSFFQSYLKNLIFAGIQAAQMCRKEDEIPKDLFPINNSAGTVNPIRIPATYQGQGCFNNSNIGLKFCPADFADSRRNNKSRFY